MESLLKLTYDSSYVNSTDAASRINIRHFSWQSLCYYLTWMMNKSRLRIAYWNSGVDAATLKI